MIDRLIAQAQKWVGYIEKASNYQLDDFTANAGYGNFTRFGRDYAKYASDGAASMEWCIAFLSCCFVYEFGYKEAKRLLGGSINCCTKLLIDPSRRIDCKGNAPKAGDIVYFFRLQDKQYGHVGLVTSVSATSFTTIEGNVVPYSTSKGGQVATRSYSLNYPYMFYFCRPLYNDICLGDRVLTNGSVGNDVKELQEKLNSLGYNCGVVDGQYGMKTVNSIKKFQQASGLYADGIAGKQTLVKLISKNNNLNQTNNGTVINRVLRFGFIGDDVKWLQTQLTDLGYPCGIIDGHFGGKTLQSLKRFQKASNLTVDGIAGENTISALNGIFLKGV